MSNLYLVRHGESTWNAAGLLQGRTAHVPLSRRGTAQARAAATRLRAVPVDAVYTSDQRRCLQTARLIASAHGLAPHPDPALREQGHGSWEGGPAVRLAPLLAAAGPDWAPPGGESARRLYRRVSRFVAALPAGLDEVVVVSHGETIRALLAVLAGHPVERAPAHLPENGQVTLVPRCRVTA